MACMPTLHVRNVPIEIHRALEAKAAIEGSSLSDFVLAELEKLAMRPTPREFLELLRTREPVHLTPSAADVIRESRERD